MINENNIKNHITYLDMSEIKYLSKKYDMPIYFYYEGNDRIIHKSSNILRKKRIILMINNLLDGKPNKKIVIGNNNVNFTKKNSYEIEDKIYFGQYRHHILKPIMDKYLTDIVYEACIGYILLYKLWEKNKVPTVKQFIKIYQDNYAKLKKEKHPEWAYVTDKGIVPNEYASIFKSWKAYRKEIGKQVIKYITSTIKIKNS